MAGSRENFTDSRPQAAILVLRLPGQIDAIGGRNPWERGHPPPPPCGGRLARLNTRVGLRPTFGRLAVYLSGEGRQTPALPEGLRRSADRGAPVDQRPVRSRRPGSVETPRSPLAGSGVGCAGMEARCGDSTNSSKERRATCWYEYEFQIGRSAGRLIGPGLEPNEARAGTWTTNSCRIRHRRAPLALPREGQGRLPPHRDRRLPERRSIRALETGHRPQVRPRTRP